MDYFNELLESFNQLKKRTFKLVYINEEGEGSEGAEENARLMALQILRTVGPAPIPGLEVVQTDGGYMASGGPLGNRPASYASPEALAAKEPPEQFNKIVGALLKDPQLQQSVADYIFDQNPSMATIGGTKYDTPEMRAFLDSCVENGSKVVDNILYQLAKAANKNEARKIWKEMGFPNKMPDRTYDAAKKGGDYRDKLIRDLVHNAILGKKGLDKIFNGDKSLDAGEEGAKVVYDASPGLVIDALQSFSRLLDFAANPNTTQEDCESLKGVVSTITGKRSKASILLKAPHDSEGMIIPGDFTLMRHVMANLKSAGCSDSIGAVSLTGTTSNAINAKKGTVHEKATNICFLMDKASQTGGDTKKYKDELNDLLASNKEVVYNWMDILGGVDSWKTVDDELSEELIRYEDKLFKEPEKLNALLNEYRKSFKSLFDAADADLMIHGGLASTSGDRADNIFVYDSLEKAQKAAERLGVGFKEELTSDVIARASDSAGAEKSLKNAGEKLYTIGIGQKLYKEVVGTKMGESNNLVRLVDMITGQLADDDPNLDPSFVGEMDRRFPLHRSSAAALKRIMAGHKSIETSLNKEMDYRNVSNKKSETTPEQVAEGAMGKWKSKLSYDEIKDLGLNTFDLTTNNGRAKLVETIQRKNMISSLGSMLKEGGNQGSAAKNIILRMAFGCGGNSTDIIQSLYDQSSNKVYNFSHNHFFNGITDPSKVDIKVSGSVFTITHNGMTAKLRMESTGSGDSLKRHTRTALFYTKDTIMEASEESSISMEASKEDDTSVEEGLEELFRIQNEILKRLLS